MLSRNTFFVNKIIIMSATLEVDLKKIKQNINSIKSNLKAKQNFCLVAKADAYGLGAKKVCIATNDLVDCFAVSSKAEFFDIKRCVTKPILLLDPVYENITILAKNKAVFCVSNFDSLDKILADAERHKPQKYIIEIAINTGMNRFGFSTLNEIDEILQKIKKVQNISIFGVFSHYFEANSQKFEKLQTKRFLKIKNYICKKLNNKQLYFHISASSFAEKDVCFDMVRVGLFSYSFRQNDAVRLTSKIIDFKDLKRCDTAGYNRQFTSKTKTKLAVVAIGYADGLFRKIVEKGYVLIGDKFAKIVAICMDCILVDVTNIDCKICDEVVLLGSTKNCQIFICDMAAWCDTIEYEILTHISKRVKRKYIGETYANHNRKISCKKTFGG